MLAKKLRTKNKIANKMKLYPTKYHIFEIVIIIV